MTPTPFDDPDRFEQRWGHISPDERHSLADADPLLFVADHMSTHDRRVGSLALCMLPVGSPPTLAVIPDGPPLPRDEDCLMLLGNVAELMGANLRGLGVVHHRLGSTEITDVDRRWALALRASSLALGFDAIGVLARLYTGEIVRVGIPDVLPADYLSTVSR